MLDAVFGQAYYLRFDPKLRAAAQPYAPLGALYAAAVSRGAGHRVALFDAMLAESEGEWAQALDRWRPKVSVIYEDSFNYLSKMCLLRMREAALTMIDLARARGIPVVVAGSDATDHPEVYLGRGAAMVVTGEGEATIVDALDVMIGRRTAPDGGVPGTCWLDEDGRIVRSAARPFLRDLDGLPLPAWDLVDVERYRAVWSARHGYFSMNLATTRGCPYHCNWCAKPIYGQRYAARAPERVADEMAWLRDTYRPDHFWIADDVFGLKPGWIDAFAAAVADRGAATPFKCLLRADGVTPETAAALARAGCHTAWIGAESGSQKVLDAMEKGTRVEDIEVATTRLHAAGINVGFFLQFGYPGETRDDIERTLAMVRRCRPDDIGVSVSYPLPGTPFYERVKAQLGAKRNWVDSSDLAMMYRATYVPDFYRALHAVVHAEFRSRPAGIRRPLGRARPRWRAAAGRAWQQARLPWLRWRLSRLAGQPNAHAIGGLPVRLSPQAARAPTEQGGLGNCEL
jgi:anaerobic magnesium-protoporphyrin IX monomethyl ester cyclase